ncbi:CsgG/HfaB family protein, partial [Marisediminitalea sp.]|uniref:CsgG/HfaB family protein n=1 Tax=Marisediminitalea sp. TaxID=2662268 RepID=UPI0035118377
YVLAALVLSALAGCQSTGKGKKEFDVSQQLAAAGNYAEAIAYLQQAIAKEPDNKQYAAQLSNMRLKATQDLLGQAQALLNAASVDINAIEKAESLVNEAKQFSPNLPAIGELESKISTSRTALIDEVKEKYSEALALIDRQDWVRANLTLQQVQKLYPNFEASVPLASRIKTEGTRDYLLQAKKAFVNYEFEDAKLAARKASMLDPTNAIAKKMAADADSKNTPVFFKNLAAESVDIQNWAQVEFACDKVLAMAGDDQDCRTWKVTAVEKQVDEKVLEGTRLLQQGYIARAVKLSIEIDEATGGALPPRAAALRNAVVSRAEDIAIEYMDNGNYGVAWYMYELIGKLDPLMEGLFEKSRDVQDKIRERVIKSIAVFDFKSPSYNMDAGGLIAGKLISNLFNNASKDINILERENLKSILEEMKLGQIGVVSEDTAKEMGRLYGIDVAIMGSVLLFKVDQTRSESAETVRYQVGQEIQDNIDFLNWKALNPNPKKDELQSAPQAKIMVPVYAEKEYTVTKAKKVGFIEISYRIVDVSTGQNVSVDTIRSRLVKEDEGNDGVKDANVPYDPLEIATDTEMLQLMADQVVEDLSRKVLQPLRNREVGYFEQGEEFLLRRKEPIAALEQFINAMFDEKVKSNINSPISSKIDGYVEQIIDTYQFKN